VERSSNPIPLFAFHHDSDRGQPTCERPHSHLGNDRTQQSCERLASEVSPSCQPNKATASVATVAATVPPPCHLLQRPTIFRRSMKRMDRSQLSDSICSKRRTSSLVHYASTITVDHESSGVRDCGYGDRDSCGCLWDGQVLARPTTGVTDPTVQLRVGQ
jgi:hypothetical protein